MKNRRRALFTGVALAAVVVVLATLGSLRRPASTAAARGAVIAEDLGCFTCHGPGGRGGVPNPNTDGGEIPGWDGATAELYLESAAEIREWILDGSPGRLREALKPVAEADRPLIAMPAYRGHLSDSELDDLVSLFQAVSGYEDMPVAARSGRAAAERLGCFGCHGPGGRTGDRNPGGWKGVIPPWQGEDFAELVRDDGELRGWILDGSIPRLRDDVVAKRFLDRQPIQMPAYRTVLAEGELEAIMTYIRWLGAEK